MRRLRPVDRFQIATTAVILALGVAILLRSAARGAGLDSYGLGAAFLLYGIYRTWFIVRALSRHGASP